MQENNIGHHFGPGVGLESVVGQTDRAQQVSPLRQILPHGGILCVHGVAAGDKGHDAARTYLVQRLGKEIVVNVEAQLVIGGVIDGVLAERHVAHRQIIEVLPVCLFKTGKGNIGVLIKLSGNAPGQIVQLYAVQLRRRQRIRQEAEKLPMPMDGSSTVPGWKFIFSTA